MYRLRQSRETIPLICMCYYIYVTHTHFWISYCVMKKQGWEFAHWFSVVFAQKWANERFTQKNERFAQVAQRKLAIMSESLRSLTKNEQMSESLVFVSKSLILSYLNKKQAIRWEKQWAYVIPSPAIYRHVKTNSRIWRWNGKVK